MHIKHLLEKHNIVPKKSMDQFFLRDEELLNFEIGLATLKPTDTVLEIGAGIGNLTRKISKHAKVIAIESDGRFLPLLRQIENAEIIIGDAVKILQAKKNGKNNVRFNKIISNIPYGRSQDILIELLQYQWRAAVLCVQREFAEKLQSKGKLGVAINDCCRLTYAADVPADAFYPKAVDSAIIMLKQNKLLDFAFWQFLDFIYRKKNRDVKNIVKNAPARLAKKKVHQLDIDELKILFGASKTLKKGYL